MSANDANRSWAAQQGPHILLALLVLSLVLQPFANVAGGLLIRLVLGSILLLSITIASSETGSFRIVVLAAPALFFLFVPTGISIVVGGALAIATLLFICYVLIHYIFQHESVTSATISTALVVYLIMGLVWAQAYKLLEHLRPGSFAGIASENWYEVERALYYFSYVTLTTLGFGDISPVSAEARSLVIVEAIAGQLFLVVGVASLVGIHLSQSLMQVDSK